MIMIIIIIIIIIKTIFYLSVFLFSSKPPLSVRAWLAASLLYQAVQLTESLAAAAQIPKPSKTAKMMNRHTKNLNTKTERKRGGGGGERTSFQSSFLLFFYLGSLVVLATPQKKKKKKKKKKVHTEW